MTGSHRLRMKSKKNHVCVQQLDTPLGRKLLEGIRRDDTRFKGCRIRSWFHAAPTMLPVGMVYTYVERVR